MTFVAGSECDQNHAALCCSGLLISPSQLYDPQDEQRDVAARLRS